MKKGADVKIGKSNGWTPVSHALGEIDRTHTCEVHRSSIVPSCTRRPTTAIAKRVHSSSSSSSALSAVDLSMRLLTFHGCMGCLCFSVDFLCERGANPNAQVIQFADAMQFAMFVYFRHTDTRRSTPNRIWQNEQGWAPLHAACHQASPSSHRVCSNRA